MRGIWDNLFKKIFLLVSRGRLMSIDNDDAEVQKIQVSNLAKETITDVERYQEYGFENYPVITNAEAITLFINGNRNANKGINIKVNNRGLRPTDLASGDVCIYSKDSNDTNDNRIWLKPTNNEIQIKTYDGHDIVINEDGIVITDGVNGHSVTLDDDGIIVEDGVNADNRITMDSDGVKVECTNGNKIECKNTGVKVTDLNANTIETTGSTVDINGNSKKFVTYTELNNAVTALLVLLNAHIHTCAGAGNPSSTPTVPITFDISASESTSARLG